MALRNLFVFSLVIISTQAFLGGDGPGSFLDPSQYQFFVDHCAKNNVELDQQILDDVQTCLEPIMTEVQGKEMDQKFDTLCANSAELRKCYLPVFDLLEKCVPSWVTNEKIFRPLEIFDNINKALCTKELTERVKNVVVVKKAGRSAILCYMMHYKAIGEDALGCPAVLQVLMDPNNSLKEEKVCGIVDKLESCLLETLDLCGNNKDVAVQFTKQVYDVLVGMTFKCEAHENF